jgi:hypothetical protein
MTGGFLAQLGHFGIGDPGLASFGLLGYDFDQLATDPAIYFSVTVVAAPALRAALPVPWAFHAIAGPAMLAGPAASPAASVELCTPEQEAFFRGAPAAPSCLVGTAGGLLVRGPVRCAIVAGTVTAMPAFWSRLSPPIVEGEVRPLLRVAGRVVARG